MASPVPPYTKVIPRGGLRGPSPQRVALVFTLTRNDSAGRDPRYLTPSRDLPPVTMEYMICIKVADNYHIHNIA